jgi:hypothetical protein
MADYMMYASDSDMLDTEPFFIISDLSRPGIKFQASEIRFDVNDDNVGSIIFDGKIIVSMNNIEDTEVLSNIFQLLYSVEEV